jgi:mRNA interferase MazF
LRGEIWIVNFDPTIGAEIKKKRPAVIISSDAVGILPVKLVVPITEWDARFSSNVWHVRVDPNRQNSLTKPSAVDALQVRGVDIQRLIVCIGRLSPDQLAEIAAAIAAVVEYA